MEGNITNKMRCPLCGCEDFENLMKHFKTDFDFIHAIKTEDEKNEIRVYDLLECMNCGFAMIMRRKGEEKVI